MSKKMECKEKMKNCYFCYFFIEAEIWIKMDAQKSNRPILSEKCYFCYFL